MTLITAPKPDFDRLTPPEPGAYAVTVKDMLPLGTPAAHIEMAVKWARYVCNCRHTHHFNIKEPADTTVAKMK